MRASRASGGWLWGAALAALGVILLLDNFLLISGFSVITLLPLIFVVAGAVVLLRGDVLAGGSGKTFGITRGSVETVALEVSAGAIDVQIYPLQREGRLIAGQFAADSRPALDVDGVNAKLRLDRAATPFFSFAPWQLALARDLPWSIYISTHLGQANIDCTGLIVAGGVMATGFGDIHFSPPAEALAPIYLRSSLGNIRINASDGQRVRVIGRETRLFHIHIDEARYTEVEPGVFVSAGAEDRPETTLYIASTFGDAYLT